MTDKEPKIPAYAFPTIADLRQALAADETRTAISEWLNRDEPDFESVISNSVDGSTLRAFPTKINKVVAVTSTQVHSEWAFEFLTREADRIKNFTQPFQVRNLVNEGAMELSEYWLRRVGRHEPEYGPSAKLVNLLLKHFVCLREFAPDIRGRLYRLMDAPLDRFSLGGIRILAPKMRIHKNAHMGSVRTELKYRLVQEKIRELCGPEYCPLDYDILTYNLKSNSPSVI